MVPILIILKGIQIKLQNATKIVHLFESDSY